MPQTRKIRTFGTSLNDLVGALGAQAVSTTFAEVYVALERGVADCGITDSNVATAATIGSVALPYFERTRYSQRMVLGSLAAGGALGNLIPPGITFIVYGLLTETSVGQLYLAAFLPGALMTALFMSVIFASYLVKPLDERVAHVTWRVRFAGLVDLIPTSILILVVLGTIYAGVATPAGSRGRYSTPRRKPPRGPRASSGSSSSRASF